MTVYRGWAADVVADVVGAAFNLEPEELLRERDGVRELETGPALEKRLRERNEDEEVTA